MNVDQRASELRLLFEQQANNTSTRVVAFVCAVLLAGAVLELVRRRRLREDLTPLWMTAAAAILVVGIDFDVLVGITRLIGAWTPSSTVFFLGLAFLTGISLGYAVRISTLFVQVRTLAQEVALLKLQRPGAGGAA